MPVYYLSIPFPGGTRRKKADYFPDLQGQITIT